MMRMGSLIFQRISVYQGISPALLATMSLSQGVKGSNNAELIQSLVKGSILHNQVLKEVMKETDRALFLPLNSKANPYENKPVKISAGENMTDIFTHSVILEKVSNHLEDINKNNNQKINILDIGTGNGYLATIIAKFIQKSLQQKVLSQTTEYSILGIDVSENNINFCTSLKQKIIPSSSVLLNFENKSLEQKIQEEEKYDIIIGGFYISSVMEEKLLQISNKSQNYLGIWAADGSNSGQTLFSHKFQKQLKKQEIMATMFSMPTISSQVSKYFVDKDSLPEEKEEIDEQKLRQNLLKLKKERKLNEKQKLKEELKQKILFHSKGQKLSLAKMKQIPQINAILEKLKG